MFRPLTDAISSGLTSAALLVLVGCCPPNSEFFARVNAEFRGCEVAQDCVIVDLGRPCCEIAVASDSVDEVLEEADCLTCSEDNVCFDLQAVACVEGKCEGLLEVDRQTSSEASERTARDPGS